MHKRRGLYTTVHGATKASQTIRDELGCTICFDWHFSTSAFNVEFVLLRFHFPRFNMHQFCKGWSVDDGADWLHRWRTFEKKHDRRLSLIGECFPLVQPNNVVRIFMVEQVWPRALYPRIVQDCDVGCNTSLYTHTCLSTEWFHSNSTQRCTKQLGFFFFLFFLEKMCSQ